MPLKRRGFQGQCGAVLFTRPQIDRKIPPGWLQQPFPQGFAERRWGKGLGNPSLFYVDYSFLLNSDPPPPRGSMLTGRAGAWPHEPGSPQPRYYVGVLEEIPGDAAPGPKGRAGFGVQ